MGLSVLQIVRHWPVAEIVVIGIDPANLELSLELGASDVWRVPQKSGTWEISGSPGYFDIVLECLGNAEGQELAHAMKPRVLVNCCQCEEPVAVRQAELFESGTVIYNPGWLESPDLKAVAAMYNRELIDPSVLITRRIPPIPDEYLIAVQELAEGKHIKVIIDWDMK